MARIVAGVDRVRRIVTQRVALRQVGDRYKFNFKLKNNMSVEEWMTPAADRKSARTNVKVRRFGITVATSEGTIRKVS